MIYPLGEAEVCGLHIAITVEQDVLWFEVTVANISSMQAVTKGAEIRECVLRRVEQGQVDRFASAY